MPRVTVTVRDTEGSPSPGRRVALRVAKLGSPKTYEAGHTDDSGQAMFEVGNEEFGSVYVDGVACALWNAATNPNVDVNL